MTSASQVMNFLELLLSITLLCWLFWGPWQQLVVDATRQYLFQLRDRIFVLAAEGKIGFDDAAYLEFRKRVNRSIAICHNHSLFTLLYDMTFYPLEPNSTDDDARRLETLSNLEVREALRSAYDDMLNAVLAGMMVRSIVFVFVVLPLVLPIVAFKLMVEGPMRRRRLAIRVRNAVSVMGAQSIIQAQ